MNARVIVPALIALQLTAVALVVGSLGAGQHDSGMNDPAFPAIQGTQPPGCVAQYIYDDSSRHVSRHLNNAWHACLTLR